MKRSFYLMAVIISLLFVWNTSSFAVDKIGFINLQEIMQNSNAGKKAAEEFKKFYEKETAYQKKLRDYQLLVNDTNEELKKRDQEMTQKLMPGIMKIVRTIAEKEKFTLVIDVATMPIPYYAKENDFSKKVIEEFNKLK